MIDTSPARGAISDPISMFPAQENVLSYVKAQRLYRMAEMAAARRRGISLRNVMDEFEVDERTARRMMRQFEDLFPGVETWDDVERRRRWSLKDVPYIAHRTLSENELAAFELAIRRMAREGAVHEVQALERVRDRLIASQPQPFAHGGRKYAELLLMVNGDASRPGPAQDVPEVYFNTLYNAFRTPTRVEIQYQSARDPEPRWRRIEPYAVLMGLRYYLVGKDADADAGYRQYRFDRITAIKGTIEVFKRDVEFDLEQYSALAFGSFFSEKEYGPVRWLFAPRAAANARNFVFHPTQVMTEMEDGSLLVSFMASGWLEMAWYLVQWGDAVDVLDPPELRNMLERVRRNEVDIRP